MTRGDAAVVTRGLSFTLLLGGLTALPPLAIDMSLPALTRIKDDLMVNESGVGLTLSVFLAGFALSQLALGPLSDRIGRRPVLLFGLALFAASGIGCATAASIKMLIAWRFVQGTGAAAGTVMAYAIVRDLFDGHEARRRLSVVATVIPFAPMIAPALGGGILMLTGWWGIYVVLGVAGAMVWAAAALWMPETRARRQPRMGVASAYALVLRHPQAGGFSLANALSFAMLFAWVSGSPLVLMGEAGVTPGRYSLLFAVTSGGLLVGAWINGRLAARRVSARLPLLVGLAGAAVLSLVTFVLMASAPITPVTLIPVLVLTMVCRGLAGPNMAHGALDPMPAMAGVVSAVLGFSQMAAGAAASAVVAALYPRFECMAVSGTMVVCATGALAVGIRARRGYPD